MVSGWSSDGLIEELRLIELTAQQAYNLLKELTGQGYTGISKSSASLLSDSSSRYRNNNYKLSYETLKNWNSGRTKSVSPDLQPIYTEYLYAYLRKEYSVAPEQFSRAIKRLFSWIQANDKSGSEECFRRLTECYDSYGITEQNVITKLCAENIDQQVITALRHLENDSQKLESFISAISQAAVGVLAFRSIGLKSRNALSEKKESCFGGPHSGLFNQTQEIVRRDWLAEEILSSDASVVVLEAPAGYGKTETLKQFVAGRTNVISFLQCNWDNPLASDEMWVMDSINKDLIRSSRTYEKSVSGLSKNIASKEGVEAMLAGISGAANSVSEDKYIVIDAIDELSSSDRLKLFLRQLAGARGYSWIKVVCSTRYWGDFRPDGGIEVIAPILEQDKNKLDIEMYLQRRLSNCLLENGQIVDALAEDLALKSEGIFQYAAYVANALERGQLSVDELADLPASIFNLYEYDLIRLREKEHVDSKTLNSLIHMIAASPQPVPEEILFSSLGWQCWNDIHDSVALILTEEEKPSGTTFSFFHKSFEDYLLSKKDAGKIIDEGYSLLAAGCYIARQEEGLSPLASAFIQTNLLWFLHRAKASMTMSLGTFNLASAKEEMFSDLEYANRCISLFEPADDVVLFKDAAREEKLSWSAFKVFETLSHASLPMTGNSIFDKHTCVLGMLMSGLHMVFALTSMNRFDEAYETGCDILSSLEIGCDTRLSTVIDSNSEIQQIWLDRAFLSSLALLFETLAYDVLTLGQPTKSHGFGTVRLYYENAIDAYEKAGDTEGFLKSICNLALFEVERLGPNPLAALRIQNTLEKCCLREALLAAENGDERIAIQSPLVPNRIDEICLESGFNHLNNLGYCLVAVSKASEGLAVLNTCEAIANTHREGLIQPHDTAELPHLQSMAYYQFGDYSRVVELEDEAYARLSKVWGSHSTKLCGPLNQKGSAKLFLGEPTEALACFEESLSIAREVWPATHTRLLNTQIKICDALIAMARREPDKTTRDDLINRASNLIQQTIAEGFSLNGEACWDEPSPSFLRAQTTLAHVYAETDRANEAVSICEKIVNHHRSNSEGRSSKLLGIALLSLARMQISAADYIYAMESLNEAAESLKRTLTTDNGDYKTHPIWVDLQHEMDSIVSELGKEGHARVR